MSNGEPPDYAEEFEKCKEYNKDRSPHWTLRFIHWAFRMKGNR